MSRYFALPLLLLFAVAVGCKGEAPSLSVSASRSSEQQLLGAWKGEFVFNADADLSQFDDELISVCKTMRILIDFQPGGKLKMVATMRFVKTGEQTNDMSGTWKIISSKGESMIVQTTEAGGEPEEATLVFNGANEFEMPAPEQLEPLGRMRFVRQK